jgi:D-alanyl-D-alanine carboxypeptidase
MRANLSFRVGSITKSFVGTLVLQLAAEGRLSLDDTVERWLPGRVPNGDRITVRQLLNHTSGLFNYTDDVRLFEPYLTDFAHVWTPFELLTIAVGHQPVFAPGADWSYSNTGYILLGLIVEEATGTPVDALLRERLFRPFELGRTMLARGQSLPEPFSRGYMPPRVGELFGTPGRRVDSTLIDSSWAWAAGALVSTADEVAAFYRLLLTGRVLTPAGLVAMKTVVHYGALNAYGLGLASFRLRYPCGWAWGHDGLVPGYSSFAWATAKAGRQVVLLVNTELTTDRQFYVVRTILSSALCPAA